MNPLKPASENDSLIQNVLKRAMMGAWDYKMIVGPGGYTQPQVPQPRIANTPQDLTTQINQLHAFFQASGELQQRIDAAILQEFAANDKPLSDKAARSRAISTILGLVGMPLAFALGLALAIVLHVGH